MGPGRLESSSFSSITSRVFWEKHVIVVDEKSPWFEGGPDKLDK